MNKPMSHPASSPIITLHEINFSYGGPLALSQVSLNVDEGEFLGIVGPNAGGKTTLLKIILGLLTPQSGEVLIAGHPPRKSRKDVGYVPQYPRFSRDFPITVEEVVLTGRLGKSSMFGGYHQQDRDVALAMMRETEIEHLADRMLSTLSGGQLQRVLVARALACEPRILILDEPTANIDMRVESDIFDLLKALNERMTILVVSHDIAFISQYVHRVACLNRTLVCHNTTAIDGKVINELYHNHVHMVEHDH